MVVGILNISLAIRDSHSLKDKRRVIKSLKDQIRNRFNVSISETSAQDNCKRSMLAVAMVGTDRRYVNGTLSGLVNMFHSIPHVQLITYELEFI